MLHDSRRVRSDGRIMFDEPPLNRVIQSYSEKIAQVLDCLRTQTGSLTIIQESLNTIGTATMTATPAIDGNQRRL